MYDGNPGEIDFGSSSREVRVSEGSSYRESTVYIYRERYIYILYKKIYKLPGLFSELYGNLTIL